MHQEIWKLYYFKWIITKFHWAELQNIGKTIWCAEDKVFTTTMDKTGYITLMKTLNAISWSMQFETKVSFKANILMDSFLKFETIVIDFTFNKIFDRSYEILRLSIN